jgi:hypothetical protein
MACLIITIMGTLIYVTFPTLEQAYFSSSKLFTKPVPYTKIINDWTTTAVHTVGLDSDLYIQLHVGYGYPSIEGDYTLIEYMDHIQFLQHPIYTKRIQIMKEIKEEYDF